MIILARFSKNANCVTSEQYCKAEKAAILMGKLLIFAWRCCVCVFCLPKDIKGVD